MQIKVTKALWFYGLINGLLLVALSCWLYQENQPVQITSPTHLEQSKAQCVSYAPYYGKGDSPLVEGMWVHPEQIDKDLKLLSKISHCIRTYSVGQGMDYVPEAAARLGMKVYLGAWIGWSDADNVEEIKLATQKANAYPESVTALIVGNEVFLRGEQDEASMQVYFKYAKSLSNIPITYADVWEYWIKHKGMAQYIDFQTIHILPYWENDPVAIADAVYHAEKVMNKMETLFTKPILIGETGWPSVGRQRSQSKPSLVNQAKYVREFIQKAHEKKWQYNIIEAIDQPWKRTLEGTVGGYWGLMTADILPKFSFTGPVSERQDRYGLVYIALIGAIIFIGISLCLNEQRVFALAGLAALGALGGVTTCLVYEYLIAACRDWIEWLSLGGLAVVGTLVVLMQPWHISGASQRILKTIKMFKLIFLYASVVAGYLIYFDGRYRDFPIALFALPVLIMAFDLSLRTKETFFNWLTQGIPSALAVMFAVLCFEKEAENSAAVIWLVLSILLAFASWPKQQNLNSSNIKI